MSKNIIIRDLIILVAFVFYLVNTISYSQFLRKSKVFTGKIKILHLILIWLIPFVWIFILKNLTKTTPGSYQVENKESSVPFSDNNDDANRASNMGF
jgi:hypothetical protein